MQFGKTNTAARESNRRLAFQLTPTAVAVHLSLPSDISDSTADRDDLDIADFRENFDFHDTGTYHTRN